MEIRENERIGLVGVNGSGKSTLAKIIAGLIRPTGAEILLDGVNIFNTAKISQKIFYKHVQILFQDPLASLNMRLSVFENLIEPLIYLLNIHKKSEQMELIMPLLESLKLDSNILCRYPSMISGGQAQRICLARALLVKPRLLILDESTSNLDYLLAINILDFLTSYQQYSPCAMLYISHNKELVRRFTNNILTLTPSPKGSTLSKEAY